jgi:hypothetical protein
MRLNLTVVVMAGASMLAGIGCAGEAPPEEPSGVNGAATNPSGDITVTEITGHADGTWSRTSHTIPGGTILGGQTVRVDKGDGLETSQSALYVVPCSNNWEVALFKQTGLVGNDVICLYSNGNTAKFPFGWIWPARSVYTTTPLFLYDANNNLVFSSCSHVGRYSLNLSPAATTAQQAGDTGVCHF